MSILGGYIPFLVINNRNNTNVQLDGDISNLTFEEADKKATLLGNQYRSLGILIGFLGVLVVFLSIVPIGLNLDKQMSQIFRYVNVAVLLTVLYVVIAGQHSSLKKNWIKYRRVAELSRYQGLLNAINSLKADPSNPEKNRTLYGVIHSILDGDHGQVAYNKLKARQYKNIDRLGNFLVWISFVLGFVGLVGKIAIPSNGWIFLTAFAPAAVGGILGINGFLGISGLAEQHQDMASNLLEIMNGLKEFKDYEAKDTDQLIELSTAALNTLNSRDIQWEGMARKLGLRPG